MLKIRKKNQKLNNPDILCVRVCKVLVINPNILCRRELRFPTVRDSEIAPTSFISIFLQKLYIPYVYYGRIPFPIGNRTYKVLLQKRKRKMELWIVRVSLHY